MGEVVLICVLYTALSVQGEALGIIEIEKDSITRIFLNSFVYCFVSQTICHDFKANRKRVKGKLSLHLRDSFIYIDIPVILYHEVKVQEVCEEIQRKVKEQIEIMTGLYVVEVNVFVEDLEISE